MTFQADRRQLLRLAAAGAAFGAAPVAASAASADWDGLAGLYDISPDFVNLENAYYGIMARPIADEFKRNIDFLNRENSRYLRRDFDRGGIELIRKQLAAHLGVPVDEIAITRGATESLQNLISNYRLLRKGDTILYADLDYDAMQYAMNDLARRSDAQVQVVRIPEPATRQAVLDAYDKAMRTHRRSKLMLLTHISHRTGLVMPVAELIRMAKARGIDVILDVAQSWGQLDYKLPDLGADFIGGNLHKWIGAPLGLGFLHIRKERLRDIGVHLGDEDFSATDIRSRVHAGTLNAAAIMTIPAALKLHEQIGTASKGARLRQLRDYWVRQAREVPGLQILTPDEPGMSGAVTSLRVKGHATPEANAALVNRLFDEFGILTVIRRGPVGGTCIRVTPALFTSAAQLDRLVAALRAIAV